MRGNYGRFDILIEDMFNSGICHDIYKIKVISSEEFTMYDSIYLRIKYRGKTFRCYASSEKTSSIFMRIEKHVERIDTLYNKKFEKCKEGVKVLCRATARTFTYGDLNGEMYEFIIEKSKDVQLHLYYNDYINNGEIFKDIIKQLG